MGSPAFEARVEDIAGHVTIRLIGELDIDTVPILSDCIDAIAPGVGSTVFELSELTFMDSSGLSTLLRRWKETKVAGGSFVISGVTAPIRRLLSVTGTEFLLGEEATVTVA